MKAVFISMDRKIFSKDSAVRQRMLEYGKLFENLDIIIFSDKKSGFVAEKVSENVTIYPTNSFGKWSYINDAISIGKKLLDIDYVSGDGPETAMVAMRLAKIKKAKFQLQIHTDIFNPSFSWASFLNRIRSRMVKRMLPKADSVRVVSERIKDSILKQKIKLKSDPIVLPIFQDFPDMDNSENYFVPDEYKKFEKIFITISRLEPEKNISFMLDIFKYLVALDSKIGLFIVGDGSQKDAILGKIKRLHLEDNVKMLGWIDRPWQYLKHANFFIQTSRYEGFGMTLFESALAGVPIITTDVGIIGEILEDGKSALVISDNKKETIEKIKMLLSDEDMQKRYSENASKVAKEKFMNKEQYLEAYKNTFI